MGRQQSFVKFNNLEVLKNELIKYKDREKINDNAHVIDVVTVIKGTRPFKKGDFALVVGGERWEQRNPMNLKEGLGIENIERIVFIDNEDYVMKAQFRNISLSDFLDTHFRTLNEKERDELGIIDPWANEDEMEDVN
jgi:hypothetical protein